MQEEKQRRIPVWVWIVGVVALFILCLCLVLVLAGSLFFVTESRVSEGVEEAARVVTVEVIEPDTPAPLGTATPSVGATDAAEAEGEDDEVPTTVPLATAQIGRGDTPENAALRDEIEENVSDIRGLDPREPVETVLLSREELRTRVEEDLFAELTPEDAEEISLVLQSFGFVPEDFDYYNFTLDLYSEQVAGFYDPETNEFVVVSDDENLDVLEQWTHAHEFVHALQDQYFALDRLDDEEIDSEASAALLAFVEGEAVLVQNLYLLQGYFSFEELQDILTLSFQQETPVLDNAPRVLANNLTFPYTAGFAFTEALYSDGGFEAINDAWENPPQSTEQILHPERYLAGDAPQIVALAPLTDTLGTGWQQIDEDVFGEFFLREYLAQGLGESQVDIAATGWGGDRYAVYWNESTGELVNLVRLTWDRAEDRDEFAAAFSNYTSERYGASGRVETDGGLCWQDRDVTCFYALDGDSFFVTAPSLELAAAAARAQQ